MLSELSRNSISRSVRLGLHEIPEAKAIFREEIVEALHRTGHRPSKDVPIPDEVVTETIDLTNADLALTIRKHGITGQASRDHLRRNLIVSYSTAGNMPQSLVDHLNSIDGLGSVIEQHVNAGLRFYLAEYDVNNSGAELLNQILRGFLENMAFRGKHAPPYLSAVAIVERVLAGSRPQLSESAWSIICKDLVDEVTGLHNG